MPHTPNEPKNKTVPVPESPSSPLNDMNVTFNIGEGRASRQQQQQQQQQPQGLERTALETVPEEAGGNSSISTQNNPTPLTRPRVLHNSSVASISSSFTSGLSIDQPIQPDVQCQDSCRLCNDAMNVYSEEVIALGVLCLGTCAHHTPHLVSSNLVTSIIPCISRYVMWPSHYNNNCHVIVTLS